MISSLSNKPPCEHDKNLKAVLERARETGVRFNPDKCQIARTELPFFVHTISATGLKPDHRKVEAITNMDPSTNLADLPGDGSVSWPVHSKFSFCLSSPMGSYQERQ